jgi:hypothetical protein
LRDGDKVELGGRDLTVLHTPGHTPDCICLPDERYGGQHLGRDTAGGPVRPAVDLAAELCAGGLEPGERRIPGQQVRCRGHQVRLRDPDGGLAAALGRRVGGQARRDGQPVVPGERHGTGVADRDPGHVPGGDGLLVVGQQVSRAPADPAQGDVDRGEHRGLGLIQQRQYDPEPRPGQPQAEQDRGGPADPRAVAEVVLGPHARLGHPRPEHPPPARRPVRLDLGDRPPGSALGPA